ncbi:MAG: DUF362 domain-containing protein [Promethearchaeota archaeon]|jgi:hypothetical protein
MSKNKPISFESPIGTQEGDSSGSPVGVVRMDVKKSYVGVVELLQKYLNDSDQDCWNQIKAKIDYTYENLDHALTPLEQESPFILQMKEKLEKGQKLLFKPNTVTPSNIDSQTHGQSTGTNACTNWAFIAALMRWFHEKAGISYYKMSVGEAATAMNATAGLYSKLNPEGKEITTEAVLEGKSGDFYGGWGFYFVRKYLSESLKEDDNEDPFNGYEESVNGTYIPPGLVSDKLMVYDLNRIYDNPSKGRECEIPDGVNYKSIGLHKVIVGGNPDDPEDIKAYPGCVLINVPKLKIHTNTILTNVIKNLGIGLYPMQYSKEGNLKWDYAVPHDTTMVGIKSGIPHQVWVPELDENNLPIRDDEGNYITNKTGGIDATMIDIIKAIKNQGILMFHVVDSIETINVEHGGAGIRIEEGMVFAGLDPVATDLLCARYMFSNVPIKEALEVKLDGGTAGGFPKKVPIPTRDGKNIITVDGYDCPLARDLSFERAEKRGLGKKNYYVIGYDFLTDSPIVSLKGHLGSIKNDVFSDIITQNLYYNAFQMAWDMQRTCFNYLSAVDDIYGTNLMEEFLQEFDEDGDGVVTYDENGKKGGMTAVAYMGGKSISALGTGRTNFLRENFKVRSLMYRLGNKQNNPDSHDMMSDLAITFLCSLAFYISRADVDIPDPFIPGNVYGKGRWPSIQFTRFFQMGNSIYGLTFPRLVLFPSLYANALYYADLTQNGGQYAGKLVNSINPQDINRYFSDVAKGEIDALNFKVYVPSNFDNLLGVKVPNVEITEDPMKILTASFEDGKEIWQ